MSNTSARDTIPDLLHPVWDALVADHWPTALGSSRAEDAGLTQAAMIDLFESQLQARLLDLESRRRAGARQTFYSIASAGHEGNACIARAARVDDMAFLHYRSGAFLIERARQRAGETPLFDMALSFAASARDPISGGRHKVIGSASLAIPPQTSTIASHLPKAVGAAFGIGLGRALGRATVTPADGIILCSFGDASANHSTARGAFNTAGWTAHQRTALPLLFICEDNGIGISVASPKGWVEASLRQLPGLRYFQADGRDLVEASAGARAAVDFVRRTRRPAILHLKTVRLHGHAGSDVETAYRPRDEIAREASDDPLLHGLRRLRQEAGIARQDLLDMIAGESVRVRCLFDAACGQPRLATAEEVIAPICAPSLHASERPGRVPGKEPVVMSKAIADTLDQLMTEASDIVVFGEDVGRKGGVYGATKHLAARHGKARVFDTLLDEQAILGTAIGLAQQGFLPIPEIQFLAYVHNAADQIRGEASTLRFFSNGQYDNPMVIRIAGLGYQRGFGGHFHNDNAIAAFRDIPGIVMACPSSPAEAARTLREAVRLAREERRVVLHLEPIALYNMRDLHEDGDNAFADCLPGDDAPFGEVALRGEGRDIALVTYGNGSYLSRRVVPQLNKRGIEARIIDLRWLVPLPYASLEQALAGVPRVLIVDECRVSGSPSEALMAHFHETGRSGAFARVCSHDSFIPLGPAANHVLLGEDTIVRAAGALMSQSEAGA